jgi:hypothetical protein
MAKPHAFVADKGLSTMDAHQGAADAADLH